VSWEASRALWENGDAAHLDLDWAIGGGLLFGKQKTAISGTEGMEYFSAPYSYATVRPVNAPPTQTPLNIPTRSKEATVPVLDLSLGLAFEVPGIRMSTGYRWERYFDALDAGFRERETFDRTLDGPYFRVAIGLGG